MRDETGVEIVMSDGVTVSVRVYRPDGDGPFPTLFAASPYRYDNDDVPPTMVFFWHEVGPIHWYVERGYAYVHLDVRGTGRSGGEYGFFGKRERRDLYEVIEWIAAQSWSNGRVGGIGQSYYAASQWCMASERPPHLTCIAPYDGHIDKYRGWFYSGGIRSSFLQAWWNGSVRLANLSPYNGQYPNRVRYDLCDEVMAHPVHDEWWDERRIDEALREVDIPVYSIGAWVKRDLHLEGNVRGYRLVKGPKKLAFSNPPSLPETLAEFASSAFHERVLAPFYDHYLKGEATDYTTRAPVEYLVIGGDGETQRADHWPPTGTTDRSLFLAAGPSGSVTSLNDGQLTATVEDEAGIDSYDYPDMQWAVGPVSFGPNGPDPVRRVMTYVTEPLAEDVVLAGAPSLTLFLSSTRTDADVIAKLSIQHPRTDEGRQPRAETIAKGWLRASHRALDPAESLAGEPYHTHRTREPLVPGEVYELSVALTDLAARVPAGCRLRLELTCSDSSITDQQFAHAFTPDTVGTDCYHRGGERASRLILPVLRGNL